MKFFIRACAVAAVVPAIVSAQQTGGPKAPADTLQKAQTPQAASANTPEKQPALTLPFDFSMTMFANYQYHGEQAAKSANKFDLERVYLTFKGNLGDRTSYRVTTDVFQNPSDSYYKGWTVRAKYAYLQYDYLKSKSWNASIRGGIVHTMFIDYEEGFWPRWISPTPDDRAGYFSAADPGIATIVDFPGKTAQLYAAISNGSGYSAPETDRFKDYQFRLALQPLAGSNSFLKTLAIVPWYYKGAKASEFVDGGTGQVGEVGSALDKDRWGIFAGLRDPRLTLGFDYAQRKDEGETGDNTVAVPRLVTDSTGNLVAGYAVIHPFQMINAASKSPIGIVARYDRVKPNKDSDAYYYNVITGLTFDLTKKAALSFDYQETTPVNAPIIASTRVYSVHMVANF
jgi:hypothetical protein